MSFFGTPRLIPSPLLQVPSDPFPAQPIQSKSVSALYINVDTATPKNVIAIAAATPLGVMFAQVEGNLYK